ncbi:type II toxin-antitoxin system mRNA interferase toxin, RelE/StbE family [Patescibacteria group bacterium]
MQIVYTAGFGKQHKKLPARIQDLAEEKEKVFRKDPFDSQLNTHKLHGKLVGLCSFSINHKYRVVFEFFKDRKLVCFHSISDHGVYKS